MNHQFLNYRSWLRMLASDPSQAEYARRAAHAGLLANEGSYDIRNELVDVGVNSVVATQIVERAKAVLDACDRELEAK